MSETVRVAYTSFAAGNAPMKMGKALGIFAEHGIDLVMDEYPRGGAAIKALEEGNADFAVASGLPIVRAAQRGADPVIVMSIEAENVFAIIGARSIASPQDLKGQRVGISSPDDQDGIMMRRALRDWDIDPEHDLTMVEHAGGRGAIWAALVNDEVSAMAATIPEPVHARALGLPILRDFHEVPEPYQAGSLVIKRTFGDLRRDLVETVLDAQLESVKTFHADIEASLPYLRECTRIDNEDVLREVGHLFAEAMLHYTPSQAPLSAVVRDVTAVTGAQPEVDVSRIVDPSFVARLS